MSLEKIRDALMAQSKVKRPSNPLRDCLDIRKNDSRIHNPSNALWKPGLSILKSSEMLSSHLERLGDAQGVSGRSRFKGAHRSRPLQCQLEVQISPLSWRSLAMLSLCRTSSKML